VSGRGLASRGKTLRLRRGCRGVGCSAGGPCREGMKTSHKRRGDKGCCRGEGRRGETVSGCGAATRGGCGGVDCSAGGPCREGMKTFHRRRADKGWGRGEGRQESYVAKGRDDSEVYKYLWSVRASTHHKYKSYRKKVAPFRCTMIP
jgi:hypothetical protein